MYIFNHIPKCGGLSYRALLEELFGVERVTHITINLEQEYRLNADDYRQYTVLMGHFGVKWHEVLGPGRRWMTALREPVDRVVSTYYYWRYNAPRSPESPWLYLAQTMSLDDFVRCGHYSVLQGIHNAQTWQLADDLRWLYHTVPEQDALAVAKANLDRFDFIGVYEEFEESVHRMCGYLGFAPPARAPRVNVTRKRPAVAELSPVSVELIKELNRADLELYQYALERVHCPGREAAAGGAARDKTDGRRPPLRMASVPVDQARALCLRVVSIPSSCPSWSVLEADVEIFNGGLGIWSSAPPNPLFLSYHWLTDQGEVCVLDGWRSEIRPPLQRLSAERCRMHILAPAAPGLYTLRITLVHEYVRWFDDPPLACAEDIQVTVESRPGAGIPPLTHYCIE